MVDKDNDISSSDEIAVTINAILVNLVKEDQFLCTTLLCNNVPVKAIIDTGALVSVVNAKIASENRWPIKETDKSLIGADGNKLNVQGSAVLEIQISIGKVSKSKKHRVTLIDGLAMPMLLGADLLRAFDVSVNLARKNIFFGGDIRNGVRLINDTRVQARTQKVVAAVWPRNGLMLTTRYNFNNCIMVANSITEVRRNNGQVLLLNWSDSDVELQAGSTIAGYEKLQEEITLDEDTVNLVLGIPQSNAKTIQIGAELNDEQRRDLQHLLEEFAEAFSLNGEIGKSSVLKHKIDLEENARPFVERPRRRPQIHIKEAKDQVNKLLAEGIIEESQSPWSSAYVIVKKKSGELRMCIDFRKLNTMTKKNAFPLPRIENCLENLSGRKFYSQFDFCSGYWQIEMSDESKPLTAFNTEGGHYQWKRMPFGLHGAPMSFQRTMNTLIAGIEGLEAQVYMDDVGIASYTWKEHTVALRRFFTLVIKSGMKLKSEKCLLGASKMIFLGHEVSEQGIKQDPEKVRAISKLPSPTDGKELKRILGLLSYYRKFLPTFAKLSSSLYDLTKKDVVFEWAEEQEKALRTLINELLKNGSLAYLNNVDPIVLKTDASIQGIAGMLLQQQNNEWRLVACCSRRLNTSEKNYGITDMEGLAVVYSLDKLRAYLLGRKFQILVDHCALCALKSRMLNSARLRRWAIPLK